MNVAKVAAEVAARLPAATFSFAYGSAAKTQAKAENSSNSSDAPMLDVGLVVADARSFHASNLQLNPSHYSISRVLDADSLARFQRAFGARVFFNTLIPAPDLNLLFKYGVVVEEDLAEDLEDWTHLYFAGRLHKPVHVIRPAQTHRLGNALRKNLISAVRTSLLILPERFTRFQLFHTISSLSYSGDFRMIFGENKNKVRNIVTPQLDEFDGLYASAISDLSRYVNREGRDSFVQDVSEETKLEHLVELPAAPKALLLESRNDGDTLDDIAHRDDLPRMVERSVRRIVWRSSVTQSIKNIFTAGVLKSLNYSARKIKKMF